MTTEQPVHHTDAPASPYRWVVLAVGTLGVFAALGLARFGYATVLPAMQRELVFGRTEAGIIAGANLGGYLLLAVVGGALASRYGSRLVATLGLLVLGTGMLLTGTANSVTAALIWRAVTGLGSGAANVAIMGMWSAWFPPALRGRAAGVAVAGSSLALMFTGLVTPRLLAASPHEGWHTCWLLFGAVALAVGVLVGVLLRDRPAGLIATARTATPSPSWRAMYRAPRVWHLGIVYAAFGFSYIIYMTFFMSYLQHEHGFSAPSAGRLFFLMGVCSTVCGFLWGWVSDHFGRRTALALVFLVHTVAFALFAVSGTHAGFLVSAILFGLSAWSIPAIMAATCGDLLGAQLSAAGLGFVTLFFGIGQAIAPSIAGAMADATGSFHAAFLLAAGVAFAGGVGALLMKPQMMKSQVSS